MSEENHTPGPLDDVAAIVASVEANSPHARIVSVCLVRDGVVVVTEWTVWHAVPDFRYGWHLKMLTRIE